MSNIKSNVSVIVGINNDSKTSPAITSSFTIWAQIEPISLSGTSGRNLRLYNLGKDVFYAGGIAGIIDLGQEREEGSSAVLNAENVTNIHVGSYKQNVSSISTGNYSTSVSILSDYVGGMFGFIGDQTYLSRSEFIVDGDCWVAVEEQQLVGFIEVEVMDQALHIWELSVDSRWQRRGIGQSLLQQAIIQAKQLNCDYVTLTTFRDVAWNGVYYQKLGFTIIPAEKLTLPLQAILKKEVAYGFIASSRCAMQYTV